MELKNLISIYGKPNIIECSNCHGTGCKNCNLFGYFAQTNNKNILYTFKYPFFINLKERNNVDFLRYSIIALLTLVLIIAIIITYFNTI